MRSRSTIYLAGFVLAAAALSAQEDRWLVRAVGGWNTYGGPLQISESDGDISVGFDDSYELGLETEYRFSRRFGVELAVHQSRPTLSVFTELQGGFSSSSGEVGFTPVTMGLDVHVTPGRRADLALTPMVGYAFFGDLRFGADRFSAEDTFVWGAAAALDLAIGKGPWTLSFALRYLVADYRVTGDEAEVTSIEISPWTSTLGVGYRF